MPVGVPQTPDTAKGTLRVSLEITFTPACSSVSAAWAGVVVSVVRQLMEPSS